MLISLPTLLAATIGAAATDFPTNDLPTKTEATIEELIVTANFYNASALTLPASTTLINETSIQQRHAANLDQLLGLAPNVNYATGASRGRFIQIRGIGERSEFIEPVNYSVGVLIDGIDFTGISTAATTLDIKQVEILRGPQGTLYGANALAGLVNLVSNDPTDTTEANIEATYGNYHRRGFKGAVGGAVNERLGYRLAAQTLQSDGFYDNHFLNRDDTNNIDETSLRSKFLWEASDRLQLGATVYYADIDNGYDVFNFESVRQTRSNQPGHDRQETEALGLTADWYINDGLALEGLLSTANSDLEYGFDEDWRNPGLCQTETCTYGPDGYHSAFDNYQRDNRNHALDLRLKSHPVGAARNWVLGIYSRHQQVDLARQYISGYGPDGDVFFTSQFDTSNVALYGEVTQSLTNQLSLSVGARIEDREADYSDIADARLATDETLWGGNLSLRYQLDDSHMTYATLSRGYKPGGVNTNAVVPSRLREYDTETMLNYEIGFKGILLDGTLQTQIALFYQDRRDVQTDSAIVTCPGAGQRCTFDDYLTNAAQGSNTGLEAQLDYRFSESTRLYSSVGLLKATYGDYINYQHVNADEDQGLGVDMDGRDQPQAPTYQFLFGIDASLTDQLSLDVNVEGKDDFLFSNDHEVRSSSYTLLNATLNYRLNQWNFALWGKNLTDKDVQNRAFGSFPNDPRDGYSTFGPYFQQGDPRTFGLTVRYDF